MVSNRRIGAEDSKSRAALLDATEQIMLEEGYAAVSSRRVAERAELKPQLVHYYFRTMDDLFLAAFRRRAEVGLEHLSPGAGLGRPLVRCGRSATTGEHGPEHGVRRPGQSPQVHPVRDRPLRGGFRPDRPRSWPRVMDERGVDTERFPPVAVMTVMTSIAQILVLEESLGIDAGHAETRDLVRRLLDGPDPGPSQAPGSTERACNAASADGRLLRRPGRGRHCGTGATQWCRISTWPSLEAPGTRGPRSSRRRWRGPGARPRCASTASIRAGR